jgi:hypothetical protein
MFNSITDPVLDKHENISIGMAELWMAFHIL